jgi:hypothetical protein
MYAVCMYMFIYIYVWMSIGYKIYVSMPFLM